MFFLSGRELEALLVHALDVFAGLGIDADDVAFGYEHRSGDGRSGLESDELVAALCRVSFDCVRGIGDLELHLHRKGDPDDLLFEDEGVDERIRLEELSCGADHGLFELESVRRVVLLGEPPLSAVLIEELHLSARELCLFGLLGHVEGVLDDATGDEVSHLYRVHRLSLLLAEYVGIEHFARLSLPDDKLSYGDFVIFKHPRILLHKIKTRNRL